MNYLTFLKKLKEDFLSLIYKHPKHDQPKISLLIPFQSDNIERKTNFKWLLRYWKNELPDAEIIVGRTHSGGYFSKTEALNNAADHSTGKVLVIMDADAYMLGSIIEECADRILQELENGNHLWYVPYRHLYRLKEDITEEILDSDPTDPLRLPSPPPPEYVEGDGLQSAYGHRYGAMAMVFPREAYEVLGCFDERFKGWGGEDVAILRALDTLWGKHKTTDNDIYHLWHPTIGDNPRARLWEGQHDPESNKELANAYNRATWKPSLMRALVDEGCEERRHDREHGHHYEKYDG